MAGGILTLNAGASSLKFSFRHRETGTKLSEVFRGEFEKIGTAYWSVN
jgi:acetate kinase